MTVMSQPLPPTAADAMPPGRAAPALGTSTLDWARLVRDRQAEVWRYLRYLGAKPAEADDLTQETLLAVVRSDFVEVSEPQTAGYLRTVARRQLLMLRRKQSRRCEVADVETAETVWADAMWRDRLHVDQWQDHVDAARGCVEKLEGRVRQAIDLAYRQGEVREAIAAQLEMTAGGVKTLLKRTREKLRECIEAALRQSADPNE
ncbi:ECF RNA polymerase sigma factor SigE [Botrimarina mediterranea]|uniref:ECF RNA polymerase sigma factor SigE n=2 Tax=Botrimarina mediterranea TaxID=2528022 RepID=A0A518KBS6_9BACT|nr:ECF RNA polymerase sigma factor SigE [Botrimarina mediterranea]